MTTEPKADLAPLWEAAQRVAAAADHGGHATTASCQREWDATDRELEAIGIPLYDRHAAGGPGRAWWTAQNAAGLITGRWAEGTPTVVASGDVVTAEWRVNVNDDQAAPSNDPVADVTFEVTIDHGLFGALPDACLTTGVTPASSISPDRKTLVCNLGTRDQGTA